MGRDLASTALIFDAGIELPPTSLTDNMFVIPRRVSTAEQTLVLDRSYTAERLIRSEHVPPIKFLPLHGNDVRSTLEWAKRSYDHALLFKPTSAELQTRQSMWLASRSIFGDSAQIATIEPESTTLVAALQLVAQAAKSLSPFSVNALLTSLFQRIPTWYYSVQNSNALFQVSGCMLERSQYNGEPTAFRDVFSAEDEAITRLAEYIFKSIRSTQHSVYVRHNDCAAFVEKFQKRLDVVFAHTTTKLNVQVTQSTSLALASRFKPPFASITLMEPTKSLVDFTNEAASLLR